MTAIDTAPTIRTQPRRTAARLAGFVADVMTIAGRALRAVPRDLESVMPPGVHLVVLLPRERRDAAAPDRALDRALRLPRVPDADGDPARCDRRVPRAGARHDVQNGCFDRLLPTPVRRLAILLGHLCANVAVAAGLTVPILLVGFALGVRFETGPLGVIVFVAFAAVWSLAFSGFGYAIALKTGNPGAVNSTFLLFFPFLFLTTSYVPRSQLTGWLHTVAAWNPVTYLLEGMRSLVSSGWGAARLGEALLAVVAVGALSMTLCFSALRARLRRG